MSKKIKKSNWERKEKQTKKIEKKLNIEDLLSKFFKYYKVNIVISTTIILLALFSLYSHAQKYGDIVDRGVDFKGGYQYNIYYTGNFDKHIVRDILASYPGSSVRLMESKNIVIIETPTKVNISTFLKKKGIDVKDIQVRGVSSSVGENFWKNSIKLIIIAYLLVSIIVFITFRTFIPSLAIVLAGLSDIICAMALMNVFNIPLTLGSLTALLILIGYSVDTDILLSTRVLRVKEGNIYERITNSAKAGLTMTFTSIMAMLSLYLFSTSPVLDSISLVIIFGLFADIIFTWFQNASILIFYAKQKGNN